MESFLTEGYSEESSRCHTPARRGTELRPRGARIESAPGGRSRNISGELGGRACLPSLSDASAEDLDQGSCGPAVPWDRMRHRLTPSDVRGGGKSSLSHHAFTLRRSTYRAPATTWSTDTVPHTCVSLGDRALEGVDPHSPAPLRVCITCSTWYKGLIPITMTGYLLSNNCPTPQ